MGNGGGDVNVTRRDLAAVVTIVTLTIAGAGAYFSVKGDNAATAQEVATMKAERVERITARDKQVDQIDRRLDAHDERFESMEQFQGNQQSQLTEVRTKVDDVLKVVEQINQEVTKPK